MASVELLFSLGNAVTRALSPLEDALVDEAAFSRFLGRFGWDVPPTSFQIADVRAALGIASDLAAANTLLIQVTRANDYPSLETYLDLISRFRNVVAALIAPASGPPPSGIPAEAWTVFRAELWDALLFDELEATQPGMLGALLLAGIAVEEVVDPGGVPSRLPHTKKSISWDRLGKLITDPGAIAREVYDWDKPGSALRFEVLLARLARTFPLLGLPTETALPSEARLDEYYTADNPFRPQVREVRLTLMHADGEAGSLDAALFFLPIPETADHGGPPRGLVIGPIISVTGTQPIGAFWPYSLALDFDDTSRLELLPSGAKARQVPPNGLARLESGQGRPPIVLFGSIFSHRVELTSTALELSVKGPADDPDVTLLLEVPSGSVVVDMSDADGFVGTLVKVDLDAIEFGIGIAWSSKSGFHLRGSGALEVGIPLNIDIAGVLALRELQVAAAAKNGDVTVGVGVSGSLSLGPVTASVRGIGVELSLEPVPAGQPAGLFGKIDVDVGFKPPTGAGIAVNAGPVAGGGFLLFDEDVQRYSGALALRIYEITVSAFGIIDTKLPDGSRGFSFAILISARFTPIQLGLGFTLNGVGGMLGINRTVDTAKLQDAVRAHTLDHVLFPEEPEKKALEILNDLGAFFPPAEGRYTFGPMAIIAWGDSAVIMEAELGVILELPEPIRLTILGQVKVGLPSLEKRFVKLNFDVVGVLDFAKKLFSLDASLYESEIGGYTVNGDMALRLNWGEPPNFVLAIGGFHPRYRPPAGFPPLRRVTVDLGRSGNPRITLSGYLAITSNTIQVGATAELYAAKGSFNISGSIGFDALFTFQPFTFDGAFSAGVALRKGTRHWASIHVSGTLSGPNPWHAQGEACVSFFFFDVCVGFDLDLSSRSEEPITPLPNILDKLAGELSSPRNWSAEAPPAAHQVVSLVRADRPEDRPLLDPLGAAVVKERILPLDERIDRFEHGKLGKKDPNKFFISKITLRPGTDGEKEIIEIPVVPDYFARGQFQDLKDADKLSLPAFQLMNAGTKIGSGELQAGEIEPCPTIYHTLIIDGPADESTTIGYSPSPGLTARLARRSAQALGGLRASGPEKFFGGLGTVVKTSLGAEPFTIATVADLVSRDDLLAVTVNRLGFVTKGKAHDILAEHLDANPGDHGLLQVVPRLELPNAAQS